MAANGRHFFGVTIIEDPAVGIARILLPTTPILATDSRHAHIEGLATLEAEQPDLLAYPHDVRTLVQDWESAEWAGFRLGDVGEPDAMGLLDLSPPLATPDEQWLPAFELGE